MFFIFVGSFVTCAELLLSVDLAKTFSDPFGSGEKRIRLFIAIEIICSTIAMILMSGKTNLVEENIYWIGSKVIYLPVLFICLYVIGKNFKHGGLSSQYRVLILTRHGYFVIVTGFC
jgi:hypothetical protein